MDDCAIRELAFKHRPVVYLHPAEKYMPMEFNRYINEARLKHCSSGAIFKPEEAFDDITFGQWLFDYPQINSQDYTLYLPDGMASPCIAQYNPAESATSDCKGDAKGDCKGDDNSKAPTPQPSLDSVPIYVSYRMASNFDTGFHIYISYTFMYAYNGPEPVCCF